MSATNRMPKTSPRHRPVRQEMKWGVFFVIWKMGEMLFVKKVDLSSTQGALRTVSVFFISLIWGVRTHPMTPCLRVCDKLYYESKSNPQQFDAPKRLH